MAQWPKEWTYLRAMFELQDPDYDLGSDSESDITEVGSNDADSGIDVDCSHDIPEVAETEKASDPPTINQEVLPEQSNQELQKSNSVNDAEVVDTADAVKMDTTEAAVIDIVELDIVEAVGMDTEEMDTAEAADMDTIKLDQEEIADTVNTAGTEMVITANQIVDLNSKSHRITVKDIRRSSKTAVKNIRKSERIATTSPKSVGYYKILHTSGRAA